MILCRKGFLADGYIAASPSTPDALAFKFRPSSALESQELQAEWEKHFADVRKSSAATAKFIADHLESWDLRWTEADGSKGDLVEISVEILQQINGRIRVRMLDQINLREPADARPGEAASEPAASLSETAKN